MPVPLLYLDEHISEVVARILSSRKLDVLRTQDALNQGQSDLYQLEYATTAGRCVVSHNIKDFVQLHHQSLRAARTHHGILLVAHDPRPSVVATKLLQRLTPETAESARSKLMFA